jgi:hypothetical protein
MQILRSMACRYDDFATPWYRVQEEHLKIHELYRNHSAAHVGFVNRKFWEWCAITQALEERQMLGDGKQGLGFAVGTEPLSAYFASRGCRIMATDLATELSDGGWIDTNEHASSLENLYYPELANREDFDQRVSFRPADMRRLEGVPGEQDFVWSSCALEHLGTLDAGMDFVLESSKLLRSGGVGVHTTEFNVQSRWRTVKAGGNVIYRQSDLRKLARRLKHNGFRLEPLDFNTGKHRFDTDYDTAPYMQSGKPHLKLQIDGFVATSFLLVIQRL